MATTEKYTTVIELNSEQAKHQLDELRRKVESWKSDLAEAREKKMGRGFIAEIRKELSAAEKELKKYDNEVARTIETLNNIGSASIERIEEAQKSLLRLSKEVPQDSDKYKNLSVMLGQVTQELENIKATKAFEQMQQEAVGATKSSEQLKKELAFIKQTAENAETASVKQLQLAERTAESIKSAAKKGSEEWTQANTGLETVRARLSAIDEEEKKIVRTIDRYNQELKNAGKEEKMVADEMKLVERTVNSLSSASIRDIEYSIRILNEQLQDTERSGGSVEAITSKLKQLNGELRKVQDMQRPDKEKDSFFSRMIAGLNKNWGAITQIIGAVTGLSVTIRKAVKDYAAMEEAMADTRKYTGLADAEIRGLNEDLKKMDTRTPREELNELAGAAGRLGKTSRQDILDFVEAGNMIKVALGDDLGEGAIDKVGKLAMAFGEDERMGLRGAMLATGSAVNELAQNSSAQAGYLVEFTARVAGFGKQLGLTQAQIMGFGAVMDENLLKDEMAATAFGNMLTKMQTDTAKFAKIAGMDVKAFTDLLNNDANQAILALADNLRQADPQNMMKMLDDMGLDGSRAVGVLSTLADKIDDVRARQQLASEAYAEATSIGKEYETMNNTVEAGIDKCRKQFQEMAVSLGEKLLPVVRYAISTTALLTKALSVVLGFAFQNIGVITKLTVLLVEYVAAKKLHYLWTQRQVAMSKIGLVLDSADMAVKKSLITLQKAHTLAVLAHNGVITKTVMLQRLWNEVLMRNPVGLAVTAVALLTAGVWKLFSALKASGDEQRIVNEINGQAAEKISEEKAEISMLLRVARDEKALLDKRKEAIEKLNSIIPGYNGQLNETTGKYTENAAALQAYNTLLKEKYRLEAAEGKLKELEKERFQNELEYEKKVRQTYEDERKGGSTLYKIAKGMALHPYQGQHEEYSGEGTRQLLKEQYEEENAELQKQIDIITGIRDKSKEVVDFNNQMNQSLEKQRKILEGNNEEKKKEPKNVPPYVSDEEKKGQATEQHKREIEERRRLKEAEDAAKAEADAAIAAKTHEYAMGRIAYRQYIQDMAALQKEGLEKRRDVYEKGSREYEKLNRQIEELSFRGDQQVNRMNLEDMQRDMLRCQMEIEAQAAREEITENEKQERLRLLNEAFLADKVELYKEGTKERMDAEWELEQTEQRNRMERERQYLQQLEQVRQQLLGMSNEQLLQTALAGLDELHEKGLLKEEEYQRARIAIQAQYGTALSPAEQTQQTASDMLTNARNATAATESSTPISGTIQNYKTLIEKLRELYADDEQNHEAYLLAKQQATAQFCQELAAQMQAAYNAVGQVMSAASSYFSAQQEYETSLVQKKYESQIEAAGNNQKKVKKLQEKQQKEEAAIKSKYAKRAAAIQMAQAVAQTAISAINAYSSAAAIPVTGYILAPLAAAAAIAAGMLQIATIKKQQQAQEQGYYEGGFTGGRRYKKEAGVVHEGEFVANHQAVQNPAVLPFLNFLDQAQRNNTVGSLTMQDVSRSVGGGSTQVVAPIVNVQTDNEQLREAVDAHREATERLLDRLDEGIESYTVIDGPKGLYQSLKKYENLIKKH